MDLPGGIVIIGGGAILPGVEELAQEVFGVNVKLFVPNQIGIRNPAFAHVISLSEYAGNLTDVDIIAQAAVHGDEVLRQQPIQFDRPVQPQVQPQPAAPAQPVVPAYNAEKIESPVDAQEIPAASNDSKQEPKTTFTDRMKNLIGNMFD